jgi:ribosomal protein L30E
MEEKDSLEEIKRLVKDKRLIIGTENTLKKLRVKRLEKVWLASNTSPKVKEEIEKFANMVGIQVITLPMPNDDLGTLCKKQFSVSVLSLLKGEK